jgi:hypothetical protein
MADSINNTVKRPRDVRIMIEHCMAVDRPIFIWGPPGIGKSDLIQQIGDKQGRPVIDMRLLLLEPTDLKGIPYFDQETKTMKWAAPSDLPKVGGPLDNAILFLDELTSAAPSVQASAYQLVLNRKVGEYHLPPGVSIVCAGNRDGDKGVTYKMPSPLANRLVHVEMGSNFEDWQRWAINNHIHADVVGFLSHHKQHLFNFDPKRGDRAFATPRSWFFVSQLLSDSLPESLNVALVEGTVGEGIAFEFSKHRTVSAKMPKPEEILLGRVKTLDVKDLSAMYSLTISMCYTLQEWSKRWDEPEKQMTKDIWHECVDNFLEYMMTNFQTEMVVLGAQCAFKEYELPVENRKLKSMAAFTKKYAKLILEN